MKKLILFSFLANCMLMAGPGSERMDSTAEMTVTARLEALAPEVAEAIFNDPVLFQLLKDHADTRLNGEREVRFELLNQESSRLNGWSLTDRLSPAAANHASKIPDFSLLFHLPSTKTMDSSDLSHTVVTANRYDRDDLDTFEVVGYTSSGEKVKLNSQVEPDFPVIVLGLSERDMMAREEGEKETTESRYVNAVYLTEIYLEKDLEGWLSGSPEVYGWYYSPATNGSLALEKEYPGVNNTGYGYGFNQNISVANYQSCFGVVLVEHDPGGHSLQPLPGYCGVYFTSYYQISGEDDIYGAKVISSFSQNQQHDIGYARVKFVQY